MVLTRYVSVSLDIYIAMWEGVCLVWLLVPTHCYKWPQEAEMVLTRYVSVSLAMWEGVCPVWLLVLTHCYKWPQETEMVLTHYVSVSLDI